MDNVRRNGQPGIYKLPVVHLAAEDYIPVTTLTGEQGLVALAEFIEITTKIMEEQLKLLKEERNKQAELIKQLAQKVDDLQQLAAVNATMYASTASLVDRPDGIYYNEEGIFVKLKNRIQQWISKA